MAISTDHRNSAVAPYCLRLQLLLKNLVFLMQPTEFVDLVLILTSHFHLRPANGGLLILGQLRSPMSEFAALELMGPPTMRLCSVAIS